MNQRKGLLTTVDDFLFASCDPRVCSVMRIAIGLVLLIYTSVWMADANLWFTDAGVLSGDAAASLNDERWSIFHSDFFLSSETVFLGLGLLGLHSCLFLVGVFSRLQAVGIFFWLTMFQHRNVLISDGEDTALRLFVFAMIFMPLDYAFAFRRSRVAKQHSTPLATAWALRLVQFEITAIYFSTAFSKWQGESWRDGTALYVVSKMDDVFGRFWLPDAIFETMWIVQLMTWSVLLLETFLPFGLWIKPLRKPTIVLAIGLHLSIEYAMHLFLFEWIMIIGLLAFIEPQRWRVPCKRFLASSRSLP